MPEDLNTKLEGDELQVRVSLILTQGAGYAQFEFPIDVPDQVTTVVFGDSRRVIWTWQGCATQ